VCSSYFVLKWVGIVWSMLRVDSYFEEMCKYACICVRDAHLHMCFLVAHHGGLQHSTACEDYGSLLAAIGCSRHPSVERLVPCLKELRPDCNLPYLAQNYLK
jgi:hypothetical protein